MANPAIPARKSAAPLPVPLDAARSLPALSPNAQLTTDLDWVARAVEREDLPALRQARPVVGALRARWAEMDRPANIDEIASESLLLAVSMPMSGGIDPNQLQKILCDGLAERCPTAFDLHSAAKTVMWTREFFSLPALDEELRRAARRSARYRRALATDFGRAIAKIKDDNRRYRENRKRKIAQIRECLDELRRDGQLRFPIYSLPRIGYVDPQLLTEALSNDERDQQWATLLPPDRDRMRDAAPDGWRPPPSDERAVEILDEERNP
jgi:hypothetical protein